MEPESHSEPIGPPIVSVSPSIMNKEVVNRAERNLNYFPNMPTMKLKGTLKIMSVRSAR